MLNVYWGILESTVSFFSDRFSTSTSFFAVYFMVIYTNFKPFFVLNMHIYNIGDPIYLKIPMIYINMYHKFPLELEFFKKGLMDFHFWWTKWFILHFIFSIFVIKRTVFKVLLKKIYVSAFAGRSRHCQLSTFLLHFSLGCDRAWLPEFRLKKSPLCVCCRENEISYRINYLLIFASQLIHLMEF